MGADSKIEWTHHTFNHVLGCYKVHAGCTNCYAETHQAVKMRKGGEVHWGEVWQGGDRVVVADSTWAHPLKWARAAAKSGERHRVFCASLSDVLEVPKEPTEFPRGWTPKQCNEAALRVAIVRGALETARERLWDTIRQTAFVDGTARRMISHRNSDGTYPVMPNSAGLDWLLLTKRPENWRMVPEDVRPLVWLGTSISDQTTAEEWVPRLLDAQGFRYRFLSVEPMIGPVDLSQWTERIDHCNHCGAENGPQGPDRCPECGKEGTLISTWGADEAARYRTGERYTTDEGQKDVDGGGGINWVIVGGESGPKARPCNVEWIRSIVRQCAEAGVPCHVKQLGTKPMSNGLPFVKVVGESSFSGLNDSKGGDWDEWPEGLRVRQFPGGAP